MSTGTEPSYEVTVTAAIPHTLCTDIIDTALSAGWSWWGQVNRDTSGSPPVEQYHIEELDDDGWCLRWHYVHERYVAEAIAQVLRHEHRLRPDLLRQIRSATCPDPDIDADAADCLLQIAAFGEVIYG